VINVDQPLVLGGFQTVLRELRPMLTGGEDEFQGAVASIFEAMAGPLDGAERWRVDHIRRADQDVVLGVWDLMFTATPEEVDAVVDSITSAITVPYLSLHGIDPGPDYQGWLVGKIPSATVEIWPDLGHYPHLIEQQRFIDRIRDFDATTGDGGAR
jgi:pimeloyl-ACP methyl ester carboxylesterase